MVSRKSATLVCCSLVVITCLLPVVHGQGRLSRVRDEVRVPRSAPSPDSSDPAESKSNSKPRRKSCGHSYTCDCIDDNSNPFGELISRALAPGVTMVFVGATSPFWGPSKLVDDRLRSVGYFAEYPYYHDLEGYMMVSPHITTVPFSWSLQASTEYSTDFDDITRIGNRLQLDTITRFGVDAEFNYWHEFLGTQRHDSLWTGDANVLFRIAQSEKLQVHTGIGVNWLADDVSADAGFNFTYQADFFPCEPWVASAEIDWGTLGDATLFHGRSTIGVQWHRAEVFSGFDYLDIEGTQFGTVVAGLRGWF